MCTVIKNEIWKTIQSSWQMGRRQKTNMLIREVWSKVNVLFLSAENHLVKFRWHVVKCIQHIMLKQPLSELVMPNN